MLFLQKKTTTVTKRGAFYLRKPFSLEKVPTIGENASEKPDAHRFFVEKNTRQTVLPRGTATNMRSTDTDISGSQRASTAVPAYIAR